MKRSQLCILELLFGRLSRYIYKLPLGTDFNSRPDEDDESSPNKDENRAFNSFLADLIPRSKSSATEVLPLEPEVDDTVCCFEGEPNEIAEPDGGDVDNGEVEPFREEEEVAEFGVGAVAETIRSATLFEYFSIFFANRSVNDGFELEDGLVIGADVDDDAGEENGFREASVFDTDAAVYEEPDGGLIDRFGTAAAGGEALNEVADGGEVLNLFPETAAEPCGLKKSSSPNEDQEDEAGGEDPSFARALRGSAVSGGRFKNGFVVWPVL